MEILTLSTHSNVECSTYPKATNILALHWLIHLLHNTFLVFCYVSYLFLFVLKIPLRSTGLVNMFELSPFSCILTFHREMGKLLHLEGSFHVRFSSWNQWSDTRLHKVPKLHSVGLDLFFRSWFWTDLNSKTNVCRITES